jgi:hypothetical protein
MNEETKELYSPYTVAQAKTSFIIAQNKPSFRDLEDSYGIPKSTLNDIAIKENWEAERTDYHNKIISSSQNSIKSIVAKERKKKLSKVNKIFEIGADRILEQLESNSYRITIKDLNILARLSEFLSGEVDSRQGHTWKLDKPLSEYTVEELLALKNKIIEGTAEVVEDAQEVNTEEEEKEYAEYEEILDDDL